MAQKLVPVREHNQTVLDNLEEGDLVEFPRGRVYSHWGVYIGNEEIIHLAGDENDGINGNFDSGHLFTICGRHFNKANVKIDNFWDVVGTSKAKKNNDKDKKCKPFPPNEIIERGMSRLGSIPYNVLWSNCEHFAAWCRNGENWSQQADSFLQWVMGIGTAVVVGGMAYAGYSESKKKKENTQQPL
ncbi:PLA2G16 [Mytilus coruscus]|uniref:PLA2G16 n=1 Tax=Mytilus coruscus TaxID=42192 RepID=A0A6J8B9X6_MYTCO|nr:PLA2G16 [Mytilus coruscus]